MKNMRYLLTSILMLLCFAATAQSTIKEQAEKMGAALIGKDYKTFVTFTHPTIIKEMGGTEKMAAAIEKQMKGMEQTAQILSISYDEPSSVVKEGNELQCTVPQTMILKTPQGKILTKSTLIGISTNGGAHWYFVDAGERDINAVKASLPNVSRKLELPTPVPPQFIQ
ncbi:MAG TPA: hypothetical protein PL009_01265 [Flavipsychrobacter sp.]|nr:hypothetical protein [Flavipsychrobacter sp.]